MTGDCWEKEGQFGFSPSIFVNIMIKNKASTSFSICGAPTCLSCGFGGILGHGWSQKKCTPFLSCTNEWHQLSKLHKRK